jgi:HD-GYP domain-containing protein (c-di-GMP phosphodiesterase class II)
MINFRIKIRPTVLLVFSILVGIAVLTTLGIQYYFSKKLAFASIEESVQHISEKTQQKIESFNKSNYDLLSVLQYSHTILQHPKEEQNLEFLNTFTTAISNNPYVYALYIGFENGDFYEVINLDIDDSLRIKFNASSKEKWFVVKIFEHNSTPIRLEQFLDVNLNIVRSVKKEVDYNPTLRPWYQKSLNSHDVVVTAPYAFANLDGMGITYAKKIEASKNVLGLDVSLRSFSSFLEAQKIVQKSHLYIFDQHNQVIASNMSDSHAYFKNINDVLRQSLENQSKTMPINKEDYFVSHHYLNSKSNSYLSIFVPEYEILKPFNEKIIFAIWVNMGLMIFILPLVWFSTKLIVNPINELELENEKIKRRKFDEVKLVNSSIKELYDFSKSFVSMASSIKEYEESQIKLMDSFIELIAGAIDAKSEYTGGHCKRVPILTLMIAKEASKSGQGIFKEFKFANKDEIRELSVAAWLHDCGKVTTPEYVVDKATKLETIYNRIHEIRTRFEVIYRDLIIESYEKILNKEEEQTVKKWLQKQQQLLKEEFEFVANANKGAEFMTQEDKQRIQEIAQRQWTTHFDDSLGLSYDEQLRYVKNESKIEYLLDNKPNHLIPRSPKTLLDYDKYGFKVEVPEYLYNLGEVYNLCVERGTLTAEERFKINEHMTMTIKMLEQLPFPSNLKRVPEYAAAHHETLIGTGYPRRLTKEQMSIPARIMAIADVFEALTAADRPYKEGKKLSESIKILSFMVKDQHLDEDIFKLFLRSGVYLKYAKAYLKEEQIDEVDISTYV